MRKMRARIQTVFQDPYAALNPRMSAGEYVEARGRWNDFARALGRFHDQFCGLVEDAMVECPQPDPDLLSRHLYSSLLCPYPLLERLAAHLGAGAELLGVLGGFVP